jgi:2'-5' RNA ligase
MIKHETGYMYFVAVVCPPDLNEKVLVFKQWMKDRFGCIVAMRAPAHITLLRPFWLEVERENELQQLLQSIKTNTTFFELELNGFSSFTNRVIFINVKETLALSELRLAAENVFADHLGSLIKREYRPFHPHITIANRDLKPASFEKAWPHFSAREFSEKFVNESVCLLKLNDGKWEVIAEKRL